MRKFLLYLLVALLFAPAAFGATTYRYGDNVQTVRGDAISGATVTVYVANTTTKVDLYSGPSTGFAALTNPIYSDGYGRFSFYAVAGTYDIAISGVGITSYTLEDVRIFGQEVPWYDITDYGAIAGDDIDDSSAIQLAIDAAVASGGTVFCPEGQYDVDSTLSFVSTSSIGQVVFSAYGAKFVNSTGEFGDKDYMLAVGDSTANTSNVAIEGGVYRLTSPVWSGDNTGIMITNGAHCTIRDVIVQNFRYGIRLYSTDNLGTSYCEISPKKITNCLEAIYLDPSTLGWVNENMFIGGSIQYTPSSDAVNGISNTAAISLVTRTGGRHVINGNKFYGQSLEMSTTRPDSLIKPVAVRHLGINNVFDQIRIENFDAPFYYGLSDSLAPNGVPDASYYSRYNYINTGYISYNQPDSLVYAPNSSSRYGTSVRGNTQMIVNGGNSLWSALRVNTGSSGQIAVSVHESASPEADLQIMSNGNIYMAPVAAEPDTAGRRGLVWFDGTNSQLNFYDGSAWRSLHHGVASYAYGSMYQHDTATSVTFGAANADSTIGGWSSGTLDNFTLGASSRALVAAVDGTYLINWAVSAQAAGTGKDYEFTIAVDGTPDTSGSQHFGITAATSDRTASGTALVALTAGQRVSLVVRNETDTTTLTVDHANLTAVKVD